MLLNCEDSALGLTKLEIMWCNSSEINWTPEEFESSIMKRRG